MKLRTIGCVELNSISVGLHVADEMVKAAEVQLVLARPTCPGRYLVIVTGDTGAVKSSVEAGRNIGRDMVVDWFVIPSVHESVIPAMNGTAVCPRINALGCNNKCNLAARHHTNADTKGIFFAKFCKLCRSKTANRLCKHSGNSKTNCKDKKS